MSQNYIHDLIENIISEELSRPEKIEAKTGSAAPRGYYNIRRVGSDRPLDNRVSSSEKMALLPFDEISEDEGIPEGETHDGSHETRVGLTGSMGSRLFGASTGYFADRIMRKAKV